MSKLPTKAERRAKGNTRVDVWLNEADLSTMDRMCANLSLTRSEAIRFLLRQTADPKWGEGSGEIT